MASHKWYDLQIWKKPVHGLRALTLFKHPICTDIHKINCTRPSAQAHHIIPFGEDFTLFTSYDNLTGLCASCHARQSAIEQNRAKGSNSVPDGMWTSSAFGTPTATS